MLTSHPAPRTVYHQHACWLWCPCRNAPGPGGGRYPGGRLRAGAKGAW